MPVPLYGPGHNILPTMHVADLAAYVAAVCLDPPMQQYLLAADSLRLTQREIVTAIAQRFGDTPVKELSMEELYFQQVLYRVPGQFACAHVKASRCDWPAAMPINVMLPSTWCLARCTCPYWGCAVACD